MNFEIHGKLFRSSFETTEETKEALQKSTLYVDNNFLEEYNRRIAEMQHIALCAKVYILDNYEKIKNWSKLDVEIRDNTGNITVYYNYIKKEFSKKKGRDAFDRIMQEIDTDNEKKHNPIVSLTDVVLDPTDEDFSLTINGKNHLWIDDQSVILIASYIEKELKI